MPRIPDAVQINSRTKKIERKKQEQSAFLRGKITLEQLLESYVSVHVEAGWLSDDEGFIVWLGMGKRKDGKTDEVPGEVCKSVQSAFVSAVLKCGGRVNSGKEEGAACGSAVRSHHK